MHEKSSQNVQITDDKEVIRNSKILILPGVGAFGAAMEIIKKKNIDKAIYEHIGKDKKIIGICLGMQLLMDKSEEGKLKGFGWIKGKCKKFVFDNKKLKIPHMGWNDVIPINNRLCDEISRFYFVHSYYVVPEDPEMIATVTNYGVEFVSGVQYKNIYAFQFHPEKSQALGLSILERFSHLN